MTLEERKNNTYFDQTGKQILVGDLLRIIEYRWRNRNYYIYHVVVMDDRGSFPVMSCRDYNVDKPHYRMYIVANNPQRVFEEAKIISMKDRETRRLRIKIDKN